MRAILIDSTNKEIKEVEIDDDKKVLHQWYTLIDCNLVEVAHYINEHDSILVDEEGLLKDNVEHFFYYTNSHQPFAGNGLIVGVDENGKSVSCDITLDEVTKNVVFLTKEQLYAYYHNEQEERYYTE